MLRRREGSEERIFRSQQQLSTTAVAAAASAVRQSGMTTMDAEQEFELEEVVDDDFDQEVNYGMNQ